MRPAWLAAVALTLTLGGIACAHQAPSGWQYPADCCWDRDCAPVPSNDVGENGLGFTILSTAEFIERTAARLSGDGGYHVCRKPDGSIRCFFYPPKGM